MKSKEEIRNIESDLAKEVKRIQFEIWELQKLENRKVLSSFKSLGFYIGQYFKHKKNGHTYMLSDFEFKNSRFTVILKFGSGYIYRSINQLLNNFELCK